MARGVEVIALRRGQQDHQCRGIEATATRRINERIGDGRRAVAGTRVVGSRERTVGGDKVRGERVAGRAVIARANVHTRAGEWALVTEQGVLLLVACREQHVVAISREVAKAGHAVDALDVTTAIAGSATGSAQLAASIVVTDDKVDDAADRVTAVHSGCAVLQHVDLLEGCERDAVHVDGGAVRKGPAPGYALAVDQHQSAL